MSDVGRNRNNVRFEGVSSFEVDIQLSCLMWYDQFGGCENMDYIVVDANNVQTEHICCAITDKKGETGVARKKEWLTERFAQGLVFYRLNARAKVFIEYIPAEHAWVPIEADGWMHINCLWVSGQYKGKGHAVQLLSHCIEDARQQGKKGVTILTSEKKRSYLTDPGFMKHSGFAVCDEAAPYFRLMALPFEEGVQMPRIRDCARAGRIEEKGFVLYYTAQCPFTDKYAHLVAALCKERGLPMRLVEIGSEQAAQQAPIAWTTYALFHDGEFITNEVQSESRFLAIIKSRLGES